MIHSKTFVYFHHIHMRQRAISRANVNRQSHPDHKFSQGRCLFKCLFTITRHWQMSKLFNMGTNNIEVSSILHILLLYPY